MAWLERAASVAAIAILNNDLDLRSWQKLPTQLPRLAVFRAINKFTAAHTWDLVKEKCQKIIEIIFRISSRNMRKLYMIILLLSIVILSRLLGSILMLLYNKS